MLHLHRYFFVFVLMRLVVKLYCQFLLKNDNLIPEQ